MTLGRCILLWAVALAGSLFDEQGAFLVILGAAMLVFYGGINRRRFAYLAAIPFVAAIFSYALYDYYVSPWICQQCNGYPADFTWQVLPWQNVLAHPLRMAWNGIDLSLDTIRFLLGSAPREVVFTSLCLLFAGLCMLLGYRLWIGFTFTASQSKNSCQETPPTTLPKSFPAMALVGLMLLMIMLMNAIMILRHSALLWDDLRRIYYSIPATTVMLIGIGAIAASAKGWWRYSVRLVLCVAVIGNVFALPMHQNIVANGYMKDAVAHGPKLLKALTSLAKSTTGADTGALGKPPVPYIPPRWTPEQPWLFDAGENDPLYHLFAARLNKEPPIAHWPAVPIYSDPVLNNLDK
jgi:hypothetical protein